jgi:hypothetical protein
MRWKWTGARSCLKNESAFFFLDFRLFLFYFQIKLYTRFWEQITGEKVKESGLYFTFLNRRVKGSAPVALKLRIICAA